jgi:hypothetical protein
MMAFLRESTYALSPTPLDPNARGFEFEEIQSATSPDAGARAR